MSDTPKRADTGLAEVAAMAAALGMSLTPPEPRYENTRKPKPPSPQKRAKVKAARKQRRRT